MKPDKKLIKNKPHLKPFELVLRLLLASVMSSVLAAFVVPQAPSFYLLAELYPFDIVIASYLLCFIATIPLVKRYVARLNRSLISTQDMQDNYKALPVTKKLAIGMFGWGTPVGFMMTTGEALYYGFDAVSYLVGILYWTAGGVVFGIMMIVSDYGAALFKKHILRKS